MEEIQADLIRHIAEERVRWSGDNRGRQSVNGERQVDSGDFTFQPRRQLSRLHWFNTAKAKPASTDQAVVNELDCPSLIRRYRPLAHYAQMAQMFAPAAWAQRHLEALAAS
jgi:hypothetical protein